MAVSAQGDQILFHVATCLAAEFEVMHLRALHAAACQASPAVALQYLPMQFVVALHIESESRALAADLLLQENFRLPSLEVLISLSIRFHKTVDWILRGEVGEGG